MLKILVDLQAAQSSNSRNRGIGNYALSLVRNLICLKQNDWQFHFLINGVFSESAAALAKEFGEKLGYERIHVFWSVEASRSIDVTSGFRKEISRKIRSIVIRSVEPNVILLLSLFEGYDDDAVTDVIDSRYGITTVGVIYDLIPMLFPNLYLQNNSNRLWYYSIAKSIKQLDSVLAISRTTRNDLIKKINLSEKNVVIINGAAINLSYSHHLIFFTAIASKFGIDGRFVLYTGGNEQRKNLPFLIKAFSIAKNLPSDLKLVIVCRIDRNSINKILESAGFLETPSFLVFTNYVTDEELSQLYSQCLLFVFPSWYEGLGLPILEAAEYEVPIIGAASSSMTEIIDMVDATFDPYDIIDCAERITQGVNDERFRSKLIENSKKIKSRYNWQITALLAIDAIEKAFKARVNPGSKFGQSDYLKIANVTPLLPAQSGISSYAHEAVPAMSKFADIVSVTGQNEIDDVEILLRSDVIKPAELVERSAEFDVIVYHIGNSHFHWRDMAILQHTPGIVVLHDPFLSGVVTSECYNANDPIALFRAYDSAHGLHVAIATMQRPFEQISSMSKWLLSFWAVNPATSVLVHSEYAKTLLTEQYGCYINEKTKVINFPLQAPFPAEKHVAKRMLGIADNEIVVCSFGFIAPIKGSEEIVDGWIRAVRQSGLLLRLVLIGRPASVVFGHQLRERVARAGLADQFLITGFADSELYQRYLNVADVAIQLRRFGRGESSWTTAECLLHGIPTITCENGSLAELQRDAVHMLPNQFTSADVANALQALAQNSDERSALSQRAKAYATTQFNPETYARRLVDHAQSATRSSAFWRTALLREIALSACPKLSPFDRHVLHEAIALTFPFESSNPRVFFDISSCQIDAETDATFAAANDLSSTGKIFDLLDVSQEYFAVTTSKISGILDKQISFDAVLPRYPTRHDVIVLRLSSTINQINIKKMRQFCLSGGNAFLIVYSSDLHNVKLNEQAFKTLVDYLKAFDIKVLVSQKDYPTLVNRIDQFSNLKGNLSIIFFDESSFCLDICELIFNNRTHGTDRSMTLGQRQYFCASDDRLRIGVGRRIGPMIVTMREQGHLIFGPYIRLKPGQYHVELAMQVEVVGSNRLELVGRNQDGQRLSLGDASLPTNVVGCRTIEVTFVTEVELFDVEIQFYVDNVTKLGVTSLDVVQQQR